MHSRQHEVFPLNVHEINEAREALRRDGLYGDRLAGVEERTLQLRRSNRTLRALMAQHDDRFDLLEDSSQGQERALGAVNERIVALETASTPTLGWGFWIGVTLLSAFGWAVGSAFADAQAEIKDLRGRMDTIHQNRDLISAVADEVMSRVGAQLKRLARLEALLDRHDRLIDVHQETIRILEERLKRISPENLEGLIARLDKFELAIARDLADVDRREARMQELLKIAQELGD